LKQVDVHVKCSNITGKHTDKQMCLHRDTKVGLLADEEVEEKNDNSEYRLTDKRTNKPTQMRQTRKIHIQESVTIRRNPSKHGTLVK
jgi:hypothetical protein